MNYKAIQFEIDRLHDLCREKDTKIADLKAKIKRKDALLTDLITLYRNPYGSESSMFYVAIEAARKDLEKQGPEK